MSVLLITPPFTQLNTPYPATAYLKGFLNTKNVPSFQVDLGIEVILHLFSAKGLKDLFKQSEINIASGTENSNRIFHLKEDYIQTIDTVISFLQGKNPTLSRLICSENYLPQASRFNQLEELDWAFGSMGMQDKAKHLATLYLEDLADFIKDVVDHNFGFSRYAERLGMSANSFDTIYQELSKEASYIHKITLELLADKIRLVNPSFICFSVPFPGNLFSAFACGKYIKEHHPNIKIAMGGGFPNTELRELKDKRVFEFVDYITLDDGELPIELVYANVISKTDEFKRTFLLQNDEVTFINNTTKPDYKQLDVGTPDYSDLLLDKYISVIEIANPMHSLWSDGRWNKLTMAHGCYWGKCTFCDISLDYIRLYEPLTAKVLVDRMEQIIAQTNETGFHFVDEAAPPSLMKELALEILRRNLQVTWWTNIRFEKSFTSDLCRLLNASGCIAVSGGLEVASDRLLDLIQKRVTVEQVAQVTANLTESGIMVHAYLMYGYPTQTVQETIDSLEMVRQLFQLGIIQSGFWHQFALTTHSPIGKNPQEYNIIPHYNAIHFANNDVQFTDKTGVNHEKFSYGLKKSLYNYMHGIGFEEKVNSWFDFKTPKTSISPYFIEDCISQIPNTIVKPSHKIVWLGTSPLVKEHKGKTKLIFHSKTNEVSILLENEKAKWLEEVLPILSTNSLKPISFSQLKEKYETQFSNFELFWYSKEMDKLKELALLTL